MITVVALVLFGPRRLTKVVQRRPVICVLGSILVFAAAVANVAWVRAAGTLTGGEVSLVPIDGSESSVPAVAVGQVPLWVLQSIGAFPLRDESAPAIVYACYLIVFAVLLAYATRRADPRMRWSMGLTAMMGLLVPLSITLATAARAGTIWQGRYTLAFTVGLPILAGMAIAGSRRDQPRWGPPVLLTMTVVLLIGQAVSVLNVYRVELKNPVATVGGGWPFVPAWVLAVVVVLGLALLGSLAMNPRARRTGPRGVRAGGREVSPYEALKDR